jgi:hypothetical protein
VSETTLAQGFKDEVRYRYGLETTADIYQASRPVTDADRPLALDPESHPELFTKIKTLGFRDNDSCGSAYALCASRSVPDSEVSDADRAWAAEAVVKVAADERARALGVVDVAPAVPEGLSADQVAAFARAEVDVAVAGKSDLSSLVDLSRLSGLGLRSAGSALGVTGPLRLVQGL